MSEGGKVIETLLFDNTELFYPSNLKFILDPQNWKVTLSDFKKKYKETFTLAKNNGETIHRYRQSVSSFKVECYYESRQGSRA